MQFMFMGSAIFQDLRHAVRLLQKNASTTAVIVVTLALGMGANSAMFGVANGLLRPLPVKAPEQIVVLAAETPGDQTGFQFQLSYRGLQDLRQGTDVFQRLFGALLQIRGFSTGGKSSQFVCSAVSGEYFSTLGVRASAGRVFAPGEGEQAGASLLLVLGHSFWQKRFGGDPAVIGTQVRVDGKTATVVGVAAKEFHGLYSGVDMDGYMTLGSLISLDAFHRDFFSTRAVRSLTIFGRLKPGVTVAQAQAAVTVAARTIARQYPESEKGLSIRVLPEVSARPIPLPIVSSLSKLVRYLPPALGGLVLLISSLNVGNILLARITARRREMATRSALGATPARLIQYLIAESLLLAALGTVGGLIVGRWATHAFAASLDLAIDIPVMLDFSFDRRVFLYALLSTVCSGTLIGTWPAFRLARSGLNEALRDGARASGGRQSHRMQELIVVIQIAGSLMLLVCAGLFIRSLQDAQRVDLGFDPSHLLTVRMNPRWAGYDRQQSEAFYRDLKAKVKAWPETQAASVAFSTPLAYFMSGMKIYLNEKSLQPGEQPPVIGTNYVDDSYFDTMRIPVLRGRAFRKSDDEKAALVAIVNETMSKQFWPNENPLGKHFHAGSMDAPPMEVVGVARDSKYLTLFEQRLPYLYVPETQHYEPWQVLQIRTAVAPESLGTRLESQISSLDPNMPTSDLQTMARSLGGAQGFLSLRVGAMQASVMGMLGLVLASVGIYGVVSHRAAQQRVECGIRMALGATRVEVVASVLRRAVYLVAGGISAGLFLAVVVTKILKGLLPGISSADPIAFVLLPLLLASVAILASYIPARRAAHSDPMKVLRHQ